MHYFTTGEYRAWGCKYQTPIYTDLGGKQSAGSSSSGSSRATAPASPFGPRWRVTGTVRKGHQPIRSAGWAMVGSDGKTNAGVAIAIPRRQKRTTMEGEQTSFSNLWQSSVILCCLVILCIDLRKQ